MNQTNLTAAQFVAKRAAVMQALDAMLPSWMVNLCGVGSAFVVNEGIVGVTLL
jgi:hypothetical protein